MTIKIFGIDIRIRMKVCSVDLEISKYIIVIVNVVQ